MYCQTLSMTHNLCLQNSITFQNKIKFFASKTHPLENFENIPKSA